jgi:hypothetical protein
MKTKTTTFKQILLEVSDIESALSSYYCKEVKIAEVDCKIWLYGDGECVDWLEFAIEGSPLPAPSDSDLWDDMLEESLQRIDVDLMDENYAEILPQVFDFDAEAAFKSIDWLLS